VLQLAVGLRPRSANRVDRRVLLLELRVLEPQELVVRNEMGHHHRLPPIVLLLENLQSALVPSTVGSVGYL
jgi:hypothetical protein